VVGRAPADRTLSLSLSLSLTLLIALCVRVCTCPSLCVRGQPTLLTYSKSPSNEALPPRHHFSPRSAREFSPSNRASDSDADARLSEAVRNFHANCLASAAPLARENSYCRDIDSALGNSIFFVQARNVIRFGCSFNFNNTGIPSPVV
jgi:hypothetical protein